MAPVTAYPGCVLQPELENNRPQKYPCCHLSYRRGTWVKLLQRPNRQGADRAQLLCQESVTTWIASIPEHGEIVLDRSQFYC
ncbi:MAG: hypothetical protein AAF892_07165 [Cyanobacteria bacterium P01_D01_bin.71]